MPSLAAFVIVLSLLTGTASSAAAEVASASAQVDAGQSAQAVAAAIPGEGVLLEIALPDGRTQSFPQLGEDLVPLSGKPGEPALVARDLDGDGIDEIILRGSVPPERGAVLVFRWNPALGEFVPVDFTDDRDRTTRFLVVDATLPVRIDAAGTIEAHYQSVRRDGRKSYHVARYRWNGTGYSHTADN